MSYHAEIKFHVDGDEYICIHSAYREHPHDMVISAIYSLLNILDMCAHEFEDELLDHIKIRIDGLKEKK